MKKWIVIIVAIIIAWVGYTQWLNRGGLAPEAISETVWIKGNEEASVKIVEYSDFQCPACAAYHGLVKQLIAERGDDISFEYRHFPLTSIHPNALRAAIAAEAAGRQGKFFEMHDLLFDNQGQWSSNLSPNTKFKDYARQLGLDLDQYESDLDDPALQGEVLADVEAGEADVVRATPTFLLNGEKIESSPRSIEEFNALIDTVLGTPAANLATTTG